MLTHKKSSAPCGRLLVVMPPNSERMNQLNLNMLQHLRNEIKHVCDLIDNERAHHIKEKFDFTSHDMFRGGGHCRPNDCGGLLALLIILVFAALFIMGVQSLAYLIAQLDKAFQYYVNKYEIKTLSEDIQTSLNKLSDKLEKITGVKLDMIPEKKIAELLNDMSKLDLELKVHYDKRNREECLDAAVDVGLRYNLFKAPNAMNMITRFAGMIPEPLLIPKLGR